MNISQKISQIKLSHRRKNILTNEWVLVSPHRLNRPWQGQSEETTCPTNTRANGETNPDFE